VRRLLELFVLTAFAITQPLLDVTGRAPEFFVFHRAERTDIVLFVLVVTFAPTLVLWVVEQVVGLAGEVARRAVHLLFVTLLLTALAIQVAKKLIPDRGYSLLAMGLVLGAAATVLLLRSSTVRTFLTYLTPAPLIFALLFLLTTPVGALVTSPTTASTARASGDGARPPIVMIYFDEFPTLSLLNSKGLVDERVYPNFARLQQDSVWFRHATGVAGWTPEALPPMLTGQYAKKKLAPSYVQFPDNLFTLLSDDYRVVASESVAQLCPPTECKPAPLQRDTGLLPVLRESTATARLLVSPLKSSVEPGDQFAEAEDSGEKAAASSSESHRSDQLWFRRFVGKEHQPSRFTDFLNSLEASDEPTLHFLHILLPHAPFTHLPSGASYPDVDRAFHHTNPSTTGTPTGGELSYRQRHLLNVAYTDTLMGQVIDRLKQLGIYDQSLIVTTGDHGIWFQHGTKHPIDRDIDPKTQASVPEVAYTPTFVKLPGTAKGRIDDRNWENIDLLPTIADVLDVKIPWHVDGFSGLGPDLRKTDVKRWNNSKQKTVHFSDSKATPRLLAGVIDELAKPEHGVEGLYEYGPDRDLVNKLVSALPVSGASPASATVNLGATFSVDPKSGTIPAMIYGRVKGVPAGTPIAVAVNGTIGAVPISFADIEGKEIRFAGLVFDKRFRTGKNTLELFVVEGGPSNPVLRPLQFSRR
jgi:hypothetical protein